LLLPGDRFILRQFSPVVTVGGGVVLDAAPIPKLKQVIANTLMAVSERWDAEAMLKTRIARRWQKGISLTQLVSETGWRRDEISSRLSLSVAKRDILAFGELFLDAGAFKAVSHALPESIAEFHRKNPLVHGIAQETLREQFRLSPAVFSMVLNSLSREKQIEVTGDLVHLPGRGVAMKDEESESKMIIEQAFATAGLKVPSLKEVLAGLKVDKVRAQKIVTLLLREKTLLKISDDLVFHQSALIELRQKIVALKTTTPKIDVARFKDLTGVSRKYAIPLLEYLDRERVTRRVGDERLIL
jgi:selenocysteine-specific elongation factor